MPYLNYQDRWRATARALGYKVVDTHIEGPEGTIFYTSDATHISVVQHIERKYGIKWDTQPYSPNKVDGKHAEDTTPQP